MFYTYYADTLVTLMLGWIRGFTDWIWNIISMGDGSAGRSFLNWFSGNWIKLVLVLILIGLAADWLIWLVRWRPYWLWFGKKRRILDDTDEPGRPQKNTAPAAQAQRAEAPRFTSKALPRAQIAHPEEDFEEDDLFDVVSSAISGPSEKQTQQRLVGASVNQYLDNRGRPSAKTNMEKKKDNEIEWFD